MCLTNHVCLPRIAARRCHCSPAGAVLVQQAWRARLTHAPLHGQQGAGGYAAEGGEAMLETLQRSHAALKQVGLVQALVYTWQVRMRSS